MRIARVLGFNGRNNRKTFWFTHVTLCALFIVSISQYETIAHMTVSVISGALIFVTIISWPVLFLAGLANGVKRLHDRGKSGWWLLFILVPIIGWIWALIELGFLPGTPGPNGAQRATAVADLSKESI